MLISCSAAIFVNIRVSKRLNLWFGLTYPPSNKFLQFFSDFDHPTLAGEGGSTLIYRKNT